MTTIAIVGTGAWGTALAIHGANKGLDVALLGRRPDVVARLAATRLHPALAGAPPIPPRRDDHDERAGGVRGRRPPFSGRSPCRRRRRSSRGSRRCCRGAPLVATSKGLEIGSRRRTTEIMSFVTGRTTGLAVLSGPTFAAEVARGLPAAAVVASADPERRDGAPGASVLAHAAALSLGGRSRRRDRGRGEERRRDRGRPRGRPAPRPQHAGGAPHARARRDPAARDAPRRKPRDVLRARGRRGPHPHRDGRSLAQPARRPRPGVRKDAHRGASPRWAARWPRASRRRPCFSSSRSRRASRCRSPRWSRRFSRARRRPTDAVRNLMTRALKEEKV